MSQTNPQNITVFDIAHWFLARAKSEGTELKHMKLQKLVYFAYGWYFAYFDHPLFNEAIFAWQHGPVVADLYHHYKHYGKKPITEDFERQDISNADMDFILNGVWKAYAPHNGIYLSALTHRDGSPWYKYYFCYERNVPIAPEEIYVYFKTLKTQYDAATEK